MRQDKTLGAYPSQTHRVDAGALESDDEISIDLRVLLQKIWRGKWIILVSMILAVGIGFLIISQMEPRYKSSAKVMFDLQRRNVVNVEQVVIDSGINEDTLQNQIEILRSTNLIERVVDALSLDRNAEFNPTLRVYKPTVFDRLGEIAVMPPDLRDFLMGVGVIKSPPPPPAAEEAASRLRQTVIANVSGGLSLRPIDGSKVIEISFTSGNPKTSAAIVNAIAAQYIVDQLDAKLEATRTATSWLSTRVDELRLRVQTAEEAVATALSDISLTSGQSLEITQQQLQALNASLSVARNDASGAESRFARLQAAVADDVDYGAITEFRESALIQSYRQRESELLSQEISLRASVPETHPSLVRLNAQLDEVRRNIKDEAMRIVAAAKIDWESAQSQADTIEREVRALETKSLDQSRQEISVRQLEREAEASRVLYENFLARMKETSQQEELQSADARILSGAEPPLSPESQSKRRVLALALVMGAMSGVGVIFLLDKLNNTVRVPQQLEALTGETVLGTLPAIGAHIRRRDVIRNFRDKPKSSLAESVRSLRTSILFSNVDNPPKVVMFTSSVPREGKSTTSMLIALTSQQMGKSAIIVDCDLRLPSLARLLGANDDKPGLLSVLEGGEDLDAAIYQDEETGLHVLMTKPSEPRSGINAADIISSQRFHQLISDLKDRYDLIILDTPPTLVVADARILAKHADAIVYAVRWDHTPRAAVLEGIKELNSINAPVAGVVLTMVNESKAAKYSYDGYSYYRGRYKEYYSN